MKRVTITAVVCLAAGHLAAMNVSGQEHAEYAELAAGFSPCIRSTEPGRIDWTGGYIIAEGRGVAESTDDQGQLMAKRAARVVAARNALALAAGINVDSSGRAGDMRNGRVVLEGVVKGYEETWVQWRPDLDPPEMHVRLRVPLWGAKSVSSVFVDGHLKRVAGSGAQRVPLVVERANVDDSVLVIDARGLGLEPSLFPVIVTDGGALLYDVGRLSAETAGQRAPVYFVETEMPYDELRACIEGGDGRRSTPLRPRARLASCSGVMDKGGFMPSDPCVAPSESRSDWVGPHTPAHATLERAWSGETPPSALWATAKAEPATSQPSTQPTTEPAQESRRRPRRRMVVKAAAAKGDENTRIAVTAEDAEKVRRSAEGASLIREGRIVVVVDSAAAGTQGRLDRQTGRGVTVLARSSRP